MTEFDIVLIGAGPAAIAALAALDPASRVCVITGATQDFDNRAALHPKISSVAMERGEPPALVDPMPIEGAAKAHVFSAASVGGLANYWGQQFVRYARADAWPRSFFSSYDEYASACARVENLFAFGFGEPEVQPRSFDGYTVKPPKLLTGTRDEPRAGLLAMSRAYGGAAGGANTITLDARAIKWEPAPNAWRVALRDGRAVTGKRILVAAGVLGTMRLTMASHSDLTAAQFKDHAPWFLYTLGIERIVKTRRAAGARHFNVATIERDGAEGCVTFASVYNLGYSELNLFAATFFGKPWPILRGIPAPPGAGAVKPIQVWTSASVGVVGHKAGSANLKIANRPHRTQDADLAHFLQTLKTGGVRTLRITSTEPGLGFHHHALTVSRGGDAYEPVRDFVLRETGGGVHCIDASILDRIGCQPHTLTAMAASMAAVHANVK